MDNQKEEDEVAIDSALEHRFEVKLEVGEASKRGMLAQETQAKPIAHEAVERRGGVQILLHHGVRGKARPGAGGGGPVKVLPEAGEMDGHTRCAVRDGIGALANGFARCPKLEPAVAELPQKGQHPLLAGFGDAALGLAEAFLDRAEGAPKASDARPDAGDVLLQPAGDAVACRIEVAKLGVAGSNPR